MTEKIIRELTEDDMYGVERILDSRTHQMNSTPFIKQAQLDKVRSQSSLGIFVDGVLDGFLLWRELPNPIPRADNPELTDSPSVYITSNWFYNDPQREKTETGHNLNLQLVLLKMYDVFIEKGLYTHWHVTPASWSQYTANPIVQDAIAARFTTYTIPEIQVNDSPPSDAYGVFVMNNLFHVNKMAEPIKVRFISVKDEFRPSKVLAQKVIENTVSEPIIETKKARKKKKNKP